MRAQRPNVLRDASRGVETHRKPRIMITVSRSRRTMSRVLSNITKVASPSAFAKANRAREAIEPSRAELNRARARAFHAPLNRVTRVFAFCFPFTARLCAQAATQLRSLHRCRQPASTLSRRRGSRFAPDRSSTNDVKVRIFPARRSSRVTASGFCLTASWLPVLS